MDTRIMQVTPAEKDAVHLVQITDCHLYASEEGRLLGLPTLDSFHAVLDSVRAESVTPDLLLATGDLSQDASTESYRHLCAGVANLPYPCFWLPGNHDLPDVMSTALQGANVHPHKQILAGNWQIILLDSVVANRVYGRLDADQIELVYQALEAYPDRHALIVLHHHPVNVDCFWLDTIGLNNPEPLFEAFAEHPQKVALLWGHIHQEFDREVAGIRMLATPSTCVQFKPHTDDFQADTESPGYRLLTLHDDGRISTVVRRINHIDFTVDYSQKGY